jgi:hypothetical protein
MGRVLAKNTAEGEVTVTYLDENNSTLYADGTTSATLTGTHGDVMVYKPEFWYKYTSIDDNHFAYDIAETPGGATWIHSPASLIGAYKSYITGNMMYSRSDVVPTIDWKGYYEHVAAAEARGKGYQLIDFEQHSMIALLFYAKYGDRNSQEVLGKGTANYDSNNTTGSTNLLFGNRDTKIADNSPGYVNFEGIEGVYGGVDEYVGGVMVDNGVWTITNPNGTTTRNVQAYTDGTALGFGIITDIAASQGPYFDMVPIAITSYNDPYTYYADGYTFHNSISQPIRSYHNPDITGMGGISCISASHYDAPGTTHSNIVSRLAFRGKIKWVNSANDFIDTWTLP